MRLKVKATSAGDKALPSIHLATSRSTVIKPHMEKEAPGCVRVYHTHGLRNLYNPTRLEGEEVPIINDTLERLITSICLATHLEYVCPHIADPATQASETT